MHGKGGLGFDLLHATLILSSDWQAAAPLPRADPVLTCRSAWGAISSSTAFSGTCHRASWKSTGLTKLLTLYSAEDVRARLLCHWASGMEVLSQRAERGRGSRIT